MIKQKTLYILRHAKAETGSPAQEDHDRALTERGIGAAKAMGKYLAERGIVPDIVLCSKAQRARETWDYVQQAYESVPSTDYSEKAYLASPGELLSLVALLPESLASAMVVGHNPGLHQLCLKLSREGNDELIDTMVMKFPTCTFAAINLGNIEWRDAASAAGELTLFVTPKMIPDSL